MPKNTQMHTQWITVNGQSVPLVLPQYWDGEKWVVSSEQNPLPVKAELTEIEDGKLNVRDVDVKAELELMKQQQQQILDRLNQPVQTELTGSIVPLDVNVETVALEEQLTELDAVNGTLNFSDVIKYVDIYNRDSTEGIFNINNLDIVIPADTFFQAEIGGTPSNQIKITGSSKYIVGRYA